MAQRKGRPWYTRWYLWVGAALLLIFLLLPSFFSTRLGSGLLFGIVRAVTGQEIQAEKLSLSWFGPQKAYAITYRDKERYLLFTSRYAETDAPLFFLPSIEEDLKIHEGRLTITPPGLSAILFEEIEVVLKSRDRASPLCFAITGKTEENGRVGSFAVKGEIANLGKNQLTGTLQGSATRLPVAGIDQLLDAKGALFAALGATLDLKFSASTQRSEIALHLEADSPQLTAELDAITKKGSLQLRDPAKVLLQITPDFASRFLPLPLATPTQLSLQLSSLVCPIDGKRLEWEKSSFSGIGTLAEARFSDITLETASARFSSQEMRQGVDLDVDLHSPQFQLSTLKLAISDSIALRAPLLIATRVQGGLDLSAQISTLTLPSPIDLEKVEMQAEIEVPRWELVCQTTVDTLQEIAVSVEGNRFSTAFTALFADNTFAIRKPFNIQATLTKREVERLFPEATLAEPATIEVAMQPLSIPVRPFDLDRLRLEGRATAEALVLSSKSGEHAFPMRAPSLFFSFDGTAQKGQLSMSTQVGKGDLTLDVALSELSLDDPAEAVLTAKAKMHEMATDFIDTLAGTGHALRHLLGKELSFGLTFESRSGNQTLALDARSENLTLSSGFSVRDRLLQLDKPGLALDFVVKRDSSALFSKAPFQLQKPALCSVRIEEMQWPLVSSPQVGGQKEEVPYRLPALLWDWEGVHFKGQMRVKEIGYPQFALSDTAFDFDKEERFSFTLSSDVTPRGKVSIAGSIPSIESERIKIDAVIREFPTLILDLFAHLFGHGELSFQPIFGKTLDAEIKLDMQEYNGPLALYLNSENTRASLSGEVQSGYLMLKEPLHAQVMVTPELSALLLKDSDLFSIEEITTNSPVTLEIDSSGFLWPLHPYDPGKLFIRRGKLELGKLTCRNEGNLNIALGLLKFGRIGRGDALKLWFAPLDFSIKQGVVEIERTEVLIADQFDVALWGELDLPKAYANMVFGLTPPALERAFGIKNLPQDYVLQIPLHGPLDDVSIDRKGATAKIALLIAWQQKALAGAIGGGGTGALFGGLIGRVLPPPDFDKKPPPAKRPFPWEEPEKRRTGAKPIKREDKPVKQLLKIMQ